ncbi:hypothetical protein MMC18_005813 [Xylographa bjoerkii]|nr:hypothetical protein [Xylographa bjoerkii]
MSECARDSGTAQGGDHETSTVDIKDEEAKPIPPADKKDPADEKDIAANHAVADPNIVDWDGPNDPTNPGNWSKKRKLLYTSLVSISVLYSNIATAMFAPAASELTSEFGITSSILSTLCVTVPSLGASMGPLLFAPLMHHWMCEEYRCGDVCGVSVGACAASFMTCGGGTITDLLPKEERGAATAIFTAGPLLGPVIGPIIGGFVTQAWGWRWTFYLVLIFTVVVSAVAMATMWETNATIILAKKAARLRKETGNPNLCPACGSQVPVQQLVKRALIRPMALVFGMTYLFFATFPSVFENTYGWTVGVSRLAYLGHRIWLHYWPDNFLFAGQQTPAIRCNRQLPCKTCASKDIALFCTYTPGPQRKGAFGVGDRIQKLEALVRSLMQQQQEQQQSVNPDGLFANSLMHSFRETTSGTPQSLSIGLEGVTPLVSVDEDVLSRSSKDSAASPASSEHGNMRHVGSVHWAAILDSISELKDLYEAEGEVRSLATSDYVPHFSPGPRLLYEPVQATKDEILTSIPARAVVDRMVARYFNNQGVAPVVLDSGKVLREYENFWQDPGAAPFDLPFCYENFWQDPGAAPFDWIGLLFSIMCLSTQCHQLTEDPADLDTLMRVHAFHERTVHCLVLGQCTKGDSHVLETMIIHCTSEVFMCIDAEIGLWLLMGILVQLALSLGYHRDPQNFSHISPFAGETRRRVWAAIVQMDLRLSSQMVFPRLLESQPCDTSEPRNLLDSDFDEAPETEVTPVLYGLAKNGIDSIGVLISDLVADTREHPLSEIMDLDGKLHEAEASLPPIVLHRIVLQLAVQRLVISLHRKYLAASHAEECYEYSRNACVRAAIKILEFQQLVNEETQPDGLLYPILDLLRNTYPMWLRLSTVSQDARKAVEHLSLLLRLRYQQDGAPLAKEKTPALSTNPHDQVAWDAYQERVANFPSLFDTDPMARNPPGSSGSGDLSIEGWLLEDTSQLDEWMKLCLSPKRESRLGEKLMRIATNKAKLDQLLEKQNLKETPDPWRKAVVDISSGHTEEITFGQKYFWFLTHYIYDPTTSKTAYLGQLTGRLRIDDLVRAVETAAQRHESLCTRFFWSDDESKTPTQGILSKTLIRLETVTIESEAQAVQELNDMHNHEWNLNDWVPLRMRLLSFSDTKHYIVIGTHQISLDSLSFPVLMLDIHEAYQMPGR